MTSIFITARAVLVTFLYAVWITVMAFIIFLIALLTWIIPSKKWRQYGQRLLQKTPNLWMGGNRWIMKLHTHRKVEIAGTGALNPKGWYLVISNHRSWVDILMIGSVFNGKLPFLKFFMKKELLWQLPFAGLACYILDFPFLARHTPEQIKKRPELKGKDIESVKQACDKFKKCPSTFINFVEGTRFSEKKRLAQNSPYQYLLKPKIAGIAIVLAELKDYLNGVVNVTVLYETPQQETKPMSFWDFVCGNFHKIIVHYEVLPVTADLIGNYFEDRRYRASLQSWLNQIWERKDQLLTELEQSHKNT
jgi:1-acyl-sn-glycerol-3-phosphate acyltransferase